MPYIGKSPTGTGVRSRYYFTASGGETSLSGASDNGTTLSFTDGAYVDVSLNGVALVAGTDYNTTTANTIGGLSALSASDIVEVIVYDIFTVADAVSASSGGTFSGGVTANGGLNVGTIKEATGTTTAMTIDSSGLVLQPAKPIFYATADSTISLTTSYAEITAFSNAHVNVGSHYNTSTGRFTAPVAGVYNFGVASIGNSTATVYRFRPYKNGSSLNNYELRIQAEGGSFGTNGEFSWVVSLSASDEISIFAKSDDGTDAYSDSNFRYTYFRGHLIG